MERAHLLTEFLENAIFAILYSREIYPSELFKKIKYGPEWVFRSKLSLISDHVFAFIDSSKKWLENGRIDRIEVFITDYEREEPLERFVFKFKKIQKGKDNQESNSKITEEEKIIEQFATAVLQILVNTSHFSSRGSKFFLQFHLRDNDLGLSDSKLKVVDYIPISTVKSQYVAKMLFDNMEVEVVKEMNLEA